MMWALLGMAVVHAVELPSGSAPAPVSFPYFPDRLHAYVWFNWTLVPTARLAEVSGATPEQIVDIGKRMGLPDPHVISEDQWRRSYITIIRRNWHLLPYDQLLRLLGWTAEELAFTLREDDFLYAKLGSLKPNCEPLRYKTPSEAARAREAEIADVIRQAFPDGLDSIKDPLFGFVARLSAPPAEPIERGRQDSVFSPRFCSSYFMLYGDPYLETQADPYPDGFLARLAETGVDGVWLQAVLYKMTPLPWDESLSARWEERLTNLDKLVERAKKYGIGIYLYLNEPRAMPVSFFEKHPGLKGVEEGDYAAMCSSAPEVQDYLRNAVATICRSVPDLAGFFTITASENLTNCWSHYQGAQCPRCASIGPEEVIANANRLIREGIAQTTSGARLIAWDWGWQDPWAPGIISRLPQDVSLMSVSEWSIPFTRGGVDSVVGEYSISVVGPGPRAARHWGLARERGLKTIAKVQAGNTWELAAAPYIPAVELVAQHAANLRKANVNGLMLGWTLGGCPSPNLEVFAEMGRKEAGTVEEVLNTAARRRFGNALAPAVVEAWRAFSAAFLEYPYNGATLYLGPQHMGPANPLWEKPTGYRPTMVGFPYDAAAQWTAAFSPEIFAEQFRMMADGFDTALAALKTKTKAVEAKPEERAALAEEINVAETCAIHLRSVENQTRFVLSRDALAAAADREAAARAIAVMERAIRNEQELAIRLYDIQTRDSRMGFEATNHYFYVPLDLAAKVVNCQDLLTRWLPTEKSKWGL